jgi:hypothetical protein
MRAERNAGKHEPTLPALRAALVWGEPKPPALGQSQPPFSQPQPMHGRQLGLTSVAALLPRIGISTRRLKQLEAISLIHEQHPDAGL